MQRINKLYMIALLWLVSCVDKKTEPKVDTLGTASGFNEIKSAPKTPMEPIKKSEISQEQITTVGVDENAENTLVSIEISPGETELPVEFNITLKAVAIFKNGSKMIISNKAKWISLQPEIANFIDTKNPEKLRTITLGTVQIQVEYEKISATVNYQVKTAVLEKIEITPKIILVGTTQKLYATALFSDKTSRDVTDEINWQLVAQNYAQIVENTKIKGNAPGTVSVKAIYNGKEGGASLVEVRLKKLTEIELKYNTNVLVLGSALEWKAEGIFEDDSREDITKIATWTSSLADIAMVVSNGSNSGRINGLKNGKSTIKATLNSISQEAQVEVIIANFTSIQLEPDITKIPLGYTESFKLMGVLENGNKQDITENAIWLSLDTEFATVSNMQGLVGQVKAVAKGTATLKVTYGEFIIEKNYQITNPAVLSLEIDPLTNPYICGIDTPTLKVTGIYTDGTEANLSTLVTWESNNEEKATVSNATVDKGKINSIQVGEVKFKATYLDPVLVKNVTGEITFISDNPQILGGIIQASANPIPVGLTIQLLYLLDYSCGEHVDKTAQATFEALNPNINIDANNSYSNDVSNAEETKGIVVTSGKTQNNGVVKFKGTFQTYVAEYDLIIQPQQIISTIVNPASGQSTTFDVGASRQLQAYGLYTNGDLIEYTSTATWSSNNNLEAVVDDASQKGLVTGIKEGKTLINAMIVTAYGSFTGSKEMRIQSVCPVGGIRDHLFCFNLTANGESCTNYCANKGVSVHTIGMQHSNSQNNLASNCSDIINKAGFTVEMSNANATHDANKGLGCSLYDQLGAQAKFLFVSPTSNHDDFDTRFKRVCSCNHNPF